ncbi:MAG: sulfatase-like hydrolase/transferase, partial [Spirochaetota bacterium]
RKHAAAPEAPVFAALASVGTHIPCDGMPEEKALMYPHPSNIREKYSNALLLSDSYLKIFFDEMKKRDWLKNTAVIITSDHSFPMKEHGVYNNEICRYQEAFRVPMLILWDGVLSAKRIQNKPFSQMDIAPTVLDLAGMRKGDNSFQGASVFSAPADHPVYLVQPYNGKFLEIIRWPYKYTKHLRTGGETVYNLSLDSKEEINILSAVPSDTLERFRNDLSYFFVNQQLIETNRVWKSRE